MGSEERQTMCQFFDTSQIFLRNVLQDVKGFARGRAYVVLR